MITVQMKNTKTVCKGCALIFLFLFSFCGVVVPQEQCGQCACVGSRMKCVNVTSVPLYIPNIETLIIVGYNITNLFYNISNFTSLKTLIASKCDLININNEFSSRENLIYLDISSSGVKLIAEEAFQTNLRLKYIRLNHNQISSIPNKLFSPAAKATTISLNRNKITNISRGTFNANSKLRILDLSQNSLRKIDDNAFNISDVDSNSDVVLNISHNLLEEVGNRIFASCGHVTVLDLSHNRITSLHPTSVEGLSGLRKLLLANNRLTVLVGVPPGIREVDVSANCLWELRRGARLRLGEVPPNEPCRELLQRFLSEVGLNESDCSELVTGNCELECDEEGAEEYCVSNSGDSSTHLTPDNSDEDPSTVTSDDTTSSTTENQSRSNRGVSYFVQNRAIVLLPLLVLMYERD